MAAEESAGALVNEVYIEATPETVFSFFTDPEKVARWKGQEATVDPRPGGIYRVVINDENIVRGEYVALEPPDRVVFTWGWEAEGHPLPPGASTVEVTLAAEGEGTRLRLVHSSLPEETQGAHDEGWALYLPRLAIAAAGGDPGADPNAEAM